MDKSPTFYRLVMHEITRMLEHSDEATLENLKKAYLGAHKAAWEYTYPSKQIPYPKLVVVWRKERMLTILANTVSLYDATVHISEMLRCSALAHAITLGYADGVLAKTETVGICQTSGIDTVSYKTQVGKSKP